jgi:hypothetical protein
MLGSAESCVAVNLMQGDGKNLFLFWGVPVTIWDQHR